MRLLSGKFNHVHVINKVRVCKEFKATHNDSMPTVVRL